MTTTRQPAPTRPARLPHEDEMFEAFERRDETYEGLFFTAVKTTGIFCRPTCPARTPKRENVEFFASSRDALFAGYRPCKRCRPLEPAGQAPEWVRDLLEAVDRDPGGRLRDADLRARGLDPGRVRRWFHNHHGMTFHAYQRSRRLGQALGRLRHGDDLTSTAFGHGFDSLSGFRDAFLREFGEPPGRGRTRTSLVVTRVLTPLGPMVAGATDDGIALLEFAERRRLETQLRALRRHLDCAITPGDHPLFERLDARLGAWLDGTEQEFDLPLVLAGTDFQKAAWRALLEIPYGETRSYEQQAKALGRPTAVRAVGRANGDNRLAILVPCHRVVGADGQLCGYGGGLWRKRFLLDHELAHTAQEGVSAD